MAHLVKLPLCKQKDLSWNSEHLYKTQAWWPLSVTLML